MTDKKANSLYNVNENVIEVYNERGILMNQILNMLEAHIQNKPNVIAIQIDDQAFTYQQLEDNVSKVVESLKSLSLDAVVALNMTSPIQTIVYYLALHRLHRIPMMIEPKWQSTIHHQLFEKYNIKDVIGNNGLIQKIDSPSFIDASQLHHHQNLLHIGFTSGTTGMPKAYYRDENSWIASFEVNEMLMKRGENAIVAPGPLAHSLTLYALLYALSTGRTFIGQATFDPTKLLNQCLDNNLYKSALFVVPTMIKSLVTLFNSTYAIQSIFSSGDKLHSTVFQKLKNKAPDINLIEFFGTSETSFISYNFNQEAPLESVGILFPNVELKTLNRDQNGIGQICVKSNMTFSGYVGDKYLNDNEWIVTGDVGFVNQQYLFLTGRKHNMIIIGGHNVYPSSVEHMLKQWDKIDEAIVIGIPNEQFGQIAVLLYTSESKLTHKDVKHFLSYKVKRYEIPSIIHHVNKMFYTASGKIAREKMTTMYLRGEI
ncbi:Putative long chain fatty acid-CoA ligase vraA [Staphylococcus argenteus]|nr:Putative long chain fatty acid-CoA ligase vraA [Staphylococcus argenteus]SGW38599.1 Putative long chain fatty acid-CoA ligase vraA [Staphylococcus argenteus]SGW67422.1 Putative long chain fatty acid-CoA ligase vraA [Staphylococcus argenteus]SGX01862.1 Putative long chain fatty acid-CoA ligase vraA [Staphylococcus argenteus]SGX18824.1 Putative long chain fatty acid-CoA ligase vraA [Staphylococcus argenteus]